MKYHTPSPSPLAKILVRERIDLDENPRVSYMHKEWDDGTVQYYMITVTSGKSDIKWIGKAEWLVAAKTHPPQPTYANSDWGAGLPGAGDIWKDIPAWERG